MRPWDVGGRAGDDRSKLRAGAGVVVLVLHVVIPMLITCSFLSLSRPACLRPLAGPGMPQASKIEKPTVTGTVGSVVPPWFVDSGVGINLRLPVTPVCGAAYSLMLCSAFGARLGGGIREFSAGEFQTCSRLWLPEVSLFVLVDAVCVQL